MEIVVRAAVLFCFVWVVLRAIGRKELSQLTSFELVIVIVLGDLIQQGVTGDDRSIVGAMIAVTTFALLTAGMSYLGFRFSKLRSPLEGEPAIVVLHGKVQHQMLTTQRMNEEDLKDAAREQGIGDIADIDIGVLESDGKFSFLLASGTRPPPGRSEVQ
jgi:uncharacterized membrane protein YcaP (DUF421 family)